MSSDKTNGTYGTGETIDIDVTFSEVVTSTGNITVTLETGTTDRTCTFSVTNSNTGTCNYIVQQGDLSTDLNVIAIAGLITDIHRNETNGTMNIDTNLAVNKGIIISSPGIPIYWYKTGVDNQWGTLLGNWWTDAAHTAPAIILPDDSSAVITLGSDGPEVDVYDWIQPSSIDASNTGITFTT